MIVIVEGIDRVGKSTLCEKFVKLGFKLLNEKCELPITNLDRQLIEQERIHSQLAVLKLLSNENIVIDRFHLSQIVYGSINRNSLDVSMFKVDEELSKLNVKLVFVNPTNISKSSNEHGSNLDMHQIMFEMCKRCTKIEYCSVQYDNLEYAVNWVKEKL